MLLAGPASSLGYFFAAGAAAGALAAAGAFAAPGAGAAAAAAAFSSSSLLSAALPATMTAVAITGSLPGGRIGVTPGGSFTELKCSECSSVMAPSSTAM